MSLLLVQPCGVDDGAESRETANEKGFNGQKRKNFEYLFFIGGAVAFKRAASWQMHSPLIVKREAALGLL